MTGHYQKGWGISMKYKDIKGKGGTKFVFVDDWRKELKIAYMVVDTGSPANYFHTIISLNNGVIATFGAEEALVEAEVKLVGEGGMAKDILGVLKNVNVLLAKGKG